MEDEVSSIETPKSCNINSAIGKIEQFKLLEKLYKESERKCSNLADENEELKKKLNGASGKSSKNDEDNKLVMAKDKENEIGVLSKRTREKNESIEKLKYEKDILENKTKDLQDEVILLKATLQEDSPGKVLRRMPMEKIDILDNMENNDVIPESTDSKQKGNNGSNRKSLEIVELKLHLEQQRDYHQKLEAHCYSLQRELDEVKEQFAEEKKRNEKAEFDMADLQNQLETARCQAKVQITELTDKILLLEKQLAEDVECCQCQEFEELQEEFEKSQNISRQASRQVSELEDKVKQLEVEIAEKKESEQLQIQNQTELYKCQAKTYKEDFENEQNDHSRTKEQLKSVERQWHTLCSELTAKKGECRQKGMKITKLIEERDSLENEMEQAKGEVSRIHDRQQKVASLTPSECFTNEPYWITASSLDTKEKAGDWSCKACTYVNPSTLTECEMCEMTRKSNSTAITKTKHKSTSKEACCNTERSPPKQKESFGLHRSRLEEDSIRCY